MNIILKKKIACQEKLKKNTFKFKDLNQAFWSLKDYFRNKTDSANLLMFYMLKMCKKYDARVIYPTLATISKEIGIHETYAQKLIKIFIEDGLIAKYTYWYTNKRQTKKRASYMLSKALFLPHVQKKIFSIIKSCLSELCKILKDSFLTLYKKKKRFSFKNSSSLYKKEFRRSQHTYRNKEPDNFKEISRKKRVKQHIQNLKRLFSNW